MLSSLSKKNSRIYALEPYSPNFTRLNINLKLNQCTNVTPLQIAMGETNGTIEMTVPEDNSISDVSSVNGDFSQKIYPGVKWKKESVSIQTLDSVKTAQNIALIDLIKCDVETYEMSVFRGMDQVLKADRPTILFECFVDEERKTFFNNILSTYDYYVYAVLTDGIVYLNQGIERKGTLNFLLSPVAPQNNYLSFDQVAENPGTVLLRPSAS